MSFDYTASGNLVIGGDATETSSYYVYSSSGGMVARRCGNNVLFFPKKLLILQFVEGDRAWLRYEAQRGKLRSVWIKRIKIVSGLATLGRPTVVYFDNLNAVFNEEDLVTHADAKNIAIAYHQRRLYEAKKAIECL